MSEIKLKSQNTTTTEDKTLNQLMDIVKASEVAGESDKPFFTHDGEEISVIGDANKTEVAKNDYSINFLFKKDELEEIPSDAKVMGNLVQINKVYEDVFIEPRNFNKIASNIIEMMPFITSVSEIDEENLSQEEQATKLFQIFLTLGDQSINACYGLVATMLKIDDELANHMQSASVFSATMNIIYNNPDLFNHAEVLFG